jgi:Reverse transcriptase (RNA-dependent DNA polymerase)
MAWAKPNISHLREFGAPVWILLQGQKEQRKMLPKSKRRVYVGFDDGARAVRYYNAETRKVLTSRNFRNITPPDQPTPPEPIELTPDMPHEGEIGGNMPPMGVTGSDDRTHDLEPKRKRKRNEIEEDVDIDAPRKTRGIRTNYQNLTRGIRTEHQNLHDPFSEELEEEENFLSMEEAFAIIAGDELTSLKEAKESPEWPEWEQAMKEQLDLLKEMGTWETVQKPPDAILIANKWVFVKKRNKQGDVVRYKARLVIKGCAQCPGYDYMETFSPVVRMDTLRAILALVAEKGLKMQQMDIKGAYLNGTLKETIYMRQPEGCEDGTGRVCRLVKPLYGLKQAGREWNNELDDKLKVHEYQRLFSDPCAYIRRVNGDLGILTVWVDDSLLFASSDETMDHMKETLCSEWEVTDLGEPSKIVGIEVTRTDKTITISQEKYIENVLRKEGMLDANPVGMPMDPNLKLEPNPDDNEPNRSNSFAKLLGSLQYIANSTRPDISYAVNRLAAYTANPGLQHHGAIKRILRYLAGTKTLGITYRKSQDVTDANNLFHGYADAAYSNADDLKSTSGYVFLAGGGAITWKSKKQTVIALSSTEAEYVALSEAGREATWLRNLYGELGYPQKEPTMIKGDNEGSVVLTHNPQFHQRTKHIAIRHHWVRDLVTDNVLDIQNCRDPEQTADILTKALPKPKHQRHREEMGIQSNRKPGSFPRV